MHRKIIFSLLLTLASPCVLADVAVKQPKESNQLTSEFIYKYLVGEIAGQRGDLGLASMALYDLAKSSRDARLAERATRASIYGNQPRVALQAAALWVELDPDSIEARQALTQMLLASGKLGELRPHLQKLLAAEEDKAGLFMYMIGMLSKVPDKAAVLKLVQELARPYTDVAEAHFVVAHAAWNAKQDKVAMHELDAAEQLRMGWEPVALLKGQLLIDRSVDEALAFYEKYLEENPTSNEVRLTYARLLVNEKQFEAARKQFDKLIAVAPQSAEIRVVIGLLNVQLEDFATAEVHFLKALELGFKEPDQLYLYLAQVAERRQQFDQAQTWYGKVDKDSPQFLDAQIRNGKLLVDQGKVDEARRRLQALEITNEQRAVTNQAEANWLMQSKRTQEAFDLLKTSIETLPNSPELVYDYAMVAEKLGQFDIMEKELRKLIQLKPDMGHAYNALGYSLADRNERLEEAQKLIERAMALNPDDYYILDSMGWVQYRRGQLAQALDYLKRAFAAQPDPEIAAHLGEVLWQQGRHEEALKTWDDALREHPDNETLKNTAQKFRK